MFAGGGGIRGWWRNARRSQRGVALVITLIMLSIITFMAVTFLVLSQRERSSVSGDTDMKIARQASDTALARVSTELLSRMLLQSNFQDFDLLVSTNYINQLGLHGSVPGSLSPTNVNYDYLDTGGPILNSQDRNINIASLLYNPRAPVFVVTNKGNGSNEFRFYYDANRNGRFDRNGNFPVVVLDSGGNPQYLTTNASGQTIMTSTNITPDKWVMTNTFAGDPEWIGVLERPTELHSADNRFISRYAYIVVPVGKTLDLNSIHNQAATRTVNSATTGPVTDGFMRNQGVGTWEINLAGFLADLNTNIWYPVTNSAPLALRLPYYVYNEGSLTPAVNRGIAFDDARGILSYRYANDYTTLAAASPRFFNAALDFRTDGVDEYSDGPLMITTSTNEAAAIDQDIPTRPWAGSDNVNHYFSMQDAYNRTKTQVGYPLLLQGVSDRLQNAGTSNDTYNAYTYYRMMAQLGTDAAVDQGKINVNVKNTATNGVVVPGMETNLIAWTALDFFTNAADAMFRKLNMRDFQGNLITVTNIPVYQDPLRYNGTNINYYTPAVHRVLQLAANIFEASTNRFIGGGPTNYPTVYRPLFRSHNGVASIAGYTEVRSVGAASLPMLDPGNFVKTEQIIPNVIINLYGVPWVIGTKKGFPNFNEFSMENPLTVSRKLEFTNSSASLPLDRTKWRTNQILDFAITNSFGFEAWNSYTNLYGPNIQLTVSNEWSIFITNQNGIALLDVTNQAIGTNLNYTSWPGWSGQLMNDVSFKVPLVYSQTYTNGIYLQTPPSIHPLSPPMWDAAFIPRLTMLLQVKVRCVLVDTKANRIIDFVNLVSTQPAVDVPSQLDDQPSTLNKDNNLFAQWDTNYDNGVPWGIRNQIFASRGDMTMSDWTMAQDSNIILEQQAFRSRLMNNGVYNGITTNYFQAPYTPKRTIRQRISWQANDPLVHYTVPDLTSTNGAMADYNVVNTGVGHFALTNLGSVNFAYQPWGGYHPMNSPGSQNSNPEYDWNVQVKDPAVQQSDNWDFPTNRLPNIGWLGRIHRGTPWQTVFMKSVNITQDSWRRWANDNVLVTNYNGALTYDGLWSHPTNDYALFDVFTTMVNDNASRGRLSVNQTNLAAWSAVLAGVNVLTNTPQPFPMTVEPAGVYDPLNPSPMARIWMGINATRANTDTNFIIFENHMFQHAGDVLATPQLSSASPYLNTNSLVNNLDGGGINDEVMERIPQQVMSLLTLNQTPRFVIYSFGQTLHPADHSLVTGGTFNGLCTNYQITAESASRAVVRVEGSPNPKDDNYPPHIVVEQYNVLGPD